MARRHRESSALSSIDVTPLVDITFILLITFMVTMPAMENRIKLPEMSDQVAPNPEEEVVIWYNADGLVIIDSQTYSLEDLPSQLSVIDRTDKVFTLKADETRPYGEVISLLRTIRNAGISDVSLGTSSEN
jgi:biopolymer transport protein ExbD